MAPQVMTRQKLQATRPLDQRLEVILSPIGEGQGQYTHATTFHKNKLDNSNGPTRQYGGNHKYYSYGKAGKKSTKSKRKKKAVSLDKRIDEAILTVENDRNLALALLPNPPVWVDTAKATHE